jgi:acetyl-CoA carboxylase biotin carboxyl carrier protein
VASESSKTPRPFDMRTIKELVALMGRHDLTEIDLQEGELRIQLRRGPKETTILNPQPAAMLPVPAAPPVQSSSSSAKPGAAKPTKELLAIKSPTPGTFYSSSSPDAESFVRVGSTVTPTTVVCLIEAMKIFNEITADCSGVITEVLVENQQPVEYGQVLFKVDPTG